MRALAGPRLYLRHGVWWFYWEGKRRSTRKTDRRAAEDDVRLRLDPRHATSREKVVEDAILLVFEALDRRGRRPATKLAARQKLGHFRRLWSGRPLADIDWGVLSDYIARRLEEGAKRLTVHGEVGYLRQAWKLARSHGWTPRAWDEVCPERLERGYVPRTRWLTPHELRAVLASLPPERAAVVAWIVATGSDVGDVARAERSDVDRRRGLVRVRGTKTVFRDRWVPVTEVTRPLLERALRHGPPFVAWPWINGDLRRLAGLLGIPHFTPKDLRRTHGHWLRHAGVSPALIGRVLGHADSAMADRVYAQGSDRELARLVRLSVRRTKGLARTNARTNATGLERVSQPKRR